MQAIRLGHPQIGPCWVEFEMETETDENNYKDFAKNISLS